MAFEPKCYPCLVCGAMYQAGSSCPNGPHLFPWPTTSAGETIAKLQALLRDKNKEINQLRVSRERDEMMADNARLREAIKKIVYEYDEFDKCLTWDKNYKGSREEIKRIYQTVIVARSEKLANTIAAAEAAIKDGK